QYLTTYKQPKHRPPMLICKRVFKTPGTVLRTAFASIPCLNMKDFETLCASRCAHIPCTSHISSPVFVSSALRRPVFCLKMIARPKNTFEWPFRTGVTGEASNHPLLLSRGLIAEGAAA
ncbi:hypothetical protein EDB89DRAFT_1863608, partial [Lactarius sanguifluus]